MNVRKAALISQPKIETDRETKDEHGLVAQAKSGSSDAFAQLYERYRLRMYNIAHRVLREPQDAEDAVQRSFQRAFTNLARFREDSTFATWVTRIAINEALMMLRQRRPNIPLSGMDNADSEAPLAMALADEAPSPEQSVAANELRDAVTQAVSKLRRNLQIVVLLREFRGLTSEETAQRLGLTVAAVKGRIFHARRFLRRHLERQLRPARSSFLNGARNKHLETNPLF